MEYKNCEDYVLSEMLRLQEENEVLKKNIKQLNKQIDNIADYARSDSEDLNGRLEAQSEYVKNLEDVVKLFLVHLYRQPGTGNYVMRDFFINFTSENPKVQLVKKLYDEMKENI